MAPVDNDNDSGMESQEGSMGGSTKEEELTPESTKPPQQQAEIEGNYDDEVIYKNGNVCSKLA